MNELARATDLRDDREGLYNPIITKNFPEINRDLPIVSQDYTYTMDIMFITALGEEDFKNIKKRKTKGKNIRVPGGDNLVNCYEPDYDSALILIETTSRKTWGYPLHTKKPKEVLFVFKKFLSDVNLKISKLISDCGEEYSEIKRYNEKYKIFHYFQANASQNMHTTLSRVDRVIRTLRGLLREYYASVEEGNWVVMLNYLIKVYNNSKHSSLFLKNPDRKYRKIFYTPEQVWRTPELRRRIKIKDYLLKYKNYEYMDKYLVENAKVYYRVLPGQMKYLGHKGFISQYPAIIRDKLGNSFNIQLKSEEDLDYDGAMGEISNRFSGEKITVPARDLILFKNVSHSSKSKYKLKNFLKRLNNKTRKAIEENNNENESEGEDNRLEINEDEENEKSENDDMELEDNLEDNNIVAQQIPSPIQQIPFIPMRRDFSAKRVVKPRRTPLIQRIHNFDGSQTIKPPPPLPPISLDDMNKAPIFRGNEIDYNQQALLNNLAPYSPFNYKDLPTPPPSPKKSRPKTKKQGKRKTEAELLQTNKRWFAEEGTKRNRKKTNILDL